MDRAHQLSFCKQCKLRDFSKNEGIICSLTGSKAAFEDECPDYKVDQSLMERNKELEKQYLEDQQASDSLGLSVLGIKNEILAGSIAVVGSIVWFIAGASADIIFFYPPILFILGTATLIQGIIKSRNKAKLNRLNRQDADLLDK